MSYRNTLVLIIACLFALPAQAQDIIINSYQVEAAGASYPAALDAWWTFDSDFTDAVGTGCGGSGCDLTDNNSVGTDGSGISGNAADFISASSQYLSHADHDDLSFGDTDFTFMAWVKPDAGGTGQIFSKYNTSSNREYYGEIYLRVAGTESARFLISVDGSATATTGGSSNNDTADGSWHFVVWQYDATANEMSVLVNDGTATTASQTGGAFSGTAAFAIGAQTAGSNYFNGSIDEIAFFTKKVSATYITCIYNGGSGRGYAAASVCGDDS